MDHENYEQARRVVADAVRRALPISPDDGAVVIRYDGEDYEATPVWGNPTGVVEAITTEVMQVLFPAPVSAQVPSIDPIMRGRWTCGCDSGRCELRTDLYRDSTHQTMRITCITHGLVGQSMPARIADNQAMRQRAQVMLELDREHAQQCR